MGDASWSRLEVAQVEAHSVVLGARAIAPLKLLNPSNHGRSAWVFQSSYGGGFVGADDVRLEVQVRAGATLFLSSQASSKAYRQAHGRLELNATLEAGAVLVSWPDPTVCFAQASFTQAQRFCLADQSAGLVALEMVTSGRMARAERWLFERYASQLYLDVGGEAALREALVLSQAHGELAARLGALDALATVVITGQPTDALAASVEEAVRAAPLSRELLVVCSRAAGALVVRAASSQSAALTGRLRELLGPGVAKLLGDDPLLRKW
jgi:urease accessory protein